LITFYKIKKVPRVNFRPTKNVHALRTLVALEWIARSWVLLNPSSSLKLTQIEGELGLGFKSRFGLENEEVLKRFFEEIGFI